MTQDVEHLGPQPSNVMLSGSEASRFLGEAQMWDSSASPHNDSGTNDSDRLAL
jgi:hypothetical protein